MTNLLACLFKVFLFNSYVSVLEFKLISNLKECKKTEKKNRKTVVNACWVLVTNYDHA